MLRLRTIIILGLLSLALPAPLLAGWQWQNPLPQGNDLRDVAFISATEGFAVGECGTILYTANGGENWQSLPCPSSSLLCRIAAINAEHVWAVGFGGTILFGGATTPWTAQISGVDRNLRSVSFVNPLLGWVVGEAGTVLRTMDGGASWSGGDSVVVDSVPMSRDLLGVHFIDDTTGWAVGGDSYNSLAVMVTTTDGGLTWTSWNDSYRGWLADVYFVDALHGWTVGRESTYADLDLYTTNGGATWAGYQDEAYVMPLRAVFFADTLHGWAVGHEGEFLSSEDGGRHWMRALLDNSLRLDGLAEVGGALWVVGASGALFHRPAADTIWTRQDHGGRFPLNSIAFATPEIGYALAADGRALRTADSGATWLPDLSDSGHIMAAITFVDALTGWRIGENARFEQTTDGGASWSVTHEGGGIFNDVRFANARHGWIVGNNGEILHTTDGGATWEPETDGEYTFLSSVWPLDSSRAFMAGGGGIIYHTTDGGNVWQLQPSESSASLRDITFATDLAGWAVGDNGVIVHTTDGGETWAVQTSGTSNTLYAVVFADADTGWAAGWGGTVLYTFNGGTTWEADQSRTAANITGLTRAANGYLWLCGSDGAILTLRDHVVIPNRVDPFILHPSAFTLSAYPNPFNPTTTLTFSLKAAGPAKLRVYDLTGRLVTTLADGVFSAGTHARTFDAHGLASGIYFVRLESTGVVRTHKVALLR
jgi:photosystem II stability/assembly factor-like uncharacterized protein